VSWGAEDPPYLPHFPSWFDPSLLGGGVLRQALTSLVVRASALFSPCCTHAPQHVEMHVEGGWV